MKAWVVTLECRSPDEGGTLDHQWRYDANAETSKEAAADALAFHPGAMVVRVEEREAQRRMAR